MKTFNSKKYGKLTVLSRRRNSYIMFTCSETLTEAEAQIVQEQMGYHPCGYSFYDFNGKTWKCYSSCD